MRNRKGKIRIGRGFFESELELLQLIFEKFIPFHINNDPWDRYITYTGWSSEFDEIPEASIAPITEYNVVCTNNKDGIETIKFERIV